MRFAKVLVLGLLLGALGFSAASCDDDENEIVRTRPEGGADATFDAVTEAGPNTLACGVAVPETYESPQFAANAALEIELKGRFLALGQKMSTAEGAMMGPVTSADLTALFTAGTPSVRSIATAFAQATVDTYVAQFGDASTKTWTPADAEADGGAATGGKYDSAFIVSPIGIDLREATAKTLITGAFYNYALTLASGPITEATIDRFVALFGATTNFSNRADADAAAGAGTDADELIAEHAARRDNKAPATPGPYRKIKSALLAARAAAAQPQKCAADRDAALRTFFLEWEKTVYLTAIYSLNQAATHAMANPARGSLALHAFGEALGFVQSFKGIPQDRRKITDAQIDAILNQIGATTPYQLVTRTSERAVAFNTAFPMIGAVYGLTQIEIEDAKKAY